MVAGRYNLNKLVDHETRKEYQIDVANRFSDLEGLEISRVVDTWFIIKDSIKTSAKEKVGVLETNRNKPWFDEKCSELANKRKQIKLLWLQNPNNQTAEDLILSLILTQVSSTLDISKPSKAENLLATSI